MTVTLDKTISLTSHSRTINIDNGPVIKENRFKKKRQRKFTATTLKLHWYGDTKPGACMVHGYYITKIKGQEATVYTHRGYPLDGNEPDWLKELIHA